MKTVVLMLFCLLFFGCAGRRVFTEEELSFDRVVEAPGFSKDQIYSSAKIWIAENFKSAKAVIEYEDKEQGIIVGKGNTRFPGFWSGETVPFTMKIEIKDQKFRLTFSNLRIIFPPSTPGGASNDPMSPPFIEKMKPILMAYGDEISATLNKNKVKGDW